jgi:hypothetical protein
MRIFLPAPISQEDVKNTIGLLRSSKLIVESGAIVLDGAELAAGVIVMQSDNDVGEALDVLVRAGIRARI